jgi:acyl-CoA thioester hydrolase
MTTEFNFPIRVYYEDTDAGGVVYYANYLKFYERARTEWLNYLQVNQTELLEKNVAFVVTRAEVDYIRPARLNDQLLVKTKILKVGASAVIFDQTLYKEQNEQLERLNQAIIKVACLKLDTFSPCRIPATVKKELQRVS